ncbi:hypothetical protein BH11PLA2_BH11PLA2_18460 [soil metagenome]
MSAMLVMMLAMAAPVPKGANDGAIIIWVDDTLLQILPTGKVRAKSRIENQAARDYGIALDRNLQFAVLDTAVDSQMFFQKRIAIQPLAGDAKPTVVADHEPIQIMLNDESNGVTFRVKADNKLTSVYRYDIATAKVAKLPLPGDRVLNAVSTDESKYLMSGFVAKDNLMAWRSILLTPDGKHESEVLAPHSVIDCASFSPSGNLMLSTASVYKETIETAKASYAVWGHLVDEMTIVDLTTKKRTVIDDTAFGRSSVALAWSPDSTKIAFVRLLKVNLPDGKSPIIFAIFVADRDGGPPQEIFRIEALKLKSFQWR